MKFFVLISALLTLASCDPYRFGFKKNPAFVLDETFKSISHLDHLSFLELTSKEALCVYGNVEGVKYLKENIQFNPEEIGFIPSVLETKYFKIPNFVGYWSYYFERYYVFFLLIQMFYLEIYYNYFYDLYNAMYIVAQGTDNNKTFLLCFFQYKNNSQCHSNVE